MPSEKTGPQITIAPSQGELTGTSNIADYKKFRKMRKDPTISLGRAMVMAPIIGSQWSFEETPDAPEGAKEFIKKVMEPLKLHIVKTAIAGHIDYGFAPFEKVFTRDDAGLVTIKKLKKLYQPITKIMVDEDTGAYLGLRQYDIRGNKVDLSTDQSLCITLDYEGTNWYGEALLESVVDPYEKWNKVEEAAARYDAKVAGTHWVVYYPIGTSKVNGVEKDNYEIAKDILDACEASGRMAVPSRIQDQIDDLSDTSLAWKVELLTDNSAGRGAFTERQKYLDTLKIRGLQLPERSVLEGQFGTKAEAETHGDFAITNLELKHYVIVQELNWHLVNQLLRFNWGKYAENSIFIQSSPIADAHREYLKGIYQAVLGNPELGSEEIDKIDRDSLRDALDIPTKQIVEGSPTQKYLPGVLDPNFVINMLPDGVNL